MHSKSCEFLWDDWQGGQGVGQQGPRGSRGRPTWSRGVKGSAYRVSGGQGVGLEGPRGSRGHPWDPIDWAIGLV